jgi:hypothetical protein
MTTIASPNVTTRARAAAIENRLKLINGEYDSVVHGAEAKKLIQKAISEAGEKIASAVESNGTYETGRLIASLDALNDAKYKAIEAVTLPSLPHVPVPRV